MTRSFLILSILLFSAAAIAQNETNSTDGLSVNEHKPAAGEKSLEVQFEPFGDNPISINGIRARFFNSPRKAFRLNVFAGYNSDTDITQQENSEFDLLELKDRNSTFSLNFRPGYEWHLKGTKRLSPYFGTELDLAYQTTRRRTETQNNDDVNFTLTKNGGSSGFFRVGVNAIAGFDFYVAKKLYLGTEMGFGASLSNFLDRKVESDVTGFTEPDPEKQGSSFDLGPNVNVDIRLGYVF